VVFQNLQRFVLGGRAPAFQPCAHGLRRTVPSISRLTKWANALNRARYIHSDPDVFSLSNRLTRRRVSWLARHGDVSRVLSKNRPLFCLSHILHAQPSGLQNFCLLQCARHPPSCVTNFASGQVIGQRDESNGTVARRRPAISGCKRRKNFAFAARFKDLLSQ
jgi:hypothetical protein